MLKYFYEGGPLFMGMLTIVLLAIFVVAILKFKLLRGYTNGKNSISVDSLKSIGLFALVLGMLGQFLGLFQAFSIISQGMDISPKILAAGLKVSSITSIYGMIIFLVAYLLWFLLRAILNNKTVNQ